MANDRQIVIGRSLEKAALILRPCHDPALYKGGMEQPNDGALGKILAAGTPAEIRSHREVVSAYLGA